MGCVGHQRENRARLHVEDPATVAFPAHDFRLCGRRRVVACFLLLFWLLYASFAFTAVGVRVGVGVGVGVLSVLRAVAEDLFDDEKDNDTGEY